MAATLAQIAQLANTHYSTVSLVLNGRQLHRVSAETRERIERIAKDLGYRVNRHAQGLSHGKTRTIGLLLNQLTNPFFGTYVSILETKFESFGYHVSPFETRADIDREHELLSLYREGVCDLVISLSHYKVTLDEEFKGQPIVVRINDYRGNVSKLCPLSHVVVEYGPAIRQMVSHLESAGYKRLGLVLHRGHEPFPPRDGESQYGLLLREVLTQSSIQCGAMQQMVAHEREPMQAWFDAATTLLLRDPAIDVLLVHTMDQIVPVIEAAKRLGRTIGKDLGIVTFDDPAMAEWIEGGITVIREPTLQIADKLVELAMARLDHSPRHLAMAVEAELVTRTSTRKSL